MPETEFILGTTTCENCKSRVSIHCLCFPEADVGQYTLAKYPNIRHGLHFSVACGEWKPKTKEIENA